MADPRPLYPLFLAKEGGLSRASTDNARANPAPCRISHRGVTASDWHTNRGITWPTFSRWASAAGYSPSCANFQRMPDSLWKGIFKLAYWDQYGLDNVRNPIAAYVIMWWAWGSGLKGAYDLLKVYLKARGESPSSYKEAAAALDRVADRIGTRRMFEETRKIRMRFYATRRSAKANYRGWKNAYDRFAAWAEAGGYLSGRGRSGSGSGSTSMVLLGLGIGIAWKALRK